MLHIQTVGTPGSMHIDFSFLYNKGKTLFVTQRSSHPEVFPGKAALQVEATLLKSHFGMDDPLQICCIFSEYFFLGTPLVDCFWAQKFFSHPENTCSKLTIETLEQEVKYIVNFEHISHLILMFILVTFSR